MKHYCFKILLLLTALAVPLQAQEVSTIDPGDLKESPQRYWASFFVFADTLIETPGGRSMKIDDEDIFRFETEVAGDVYAEPLAADKLRELETGGEYLFFGTVKQQKSGLFGRLRGGDFVVIIKEVSVMERDAEAIAGMMADARAVDATNRAAVALRTLNEVSQAVQQELFGFARSEGMTVEELLADPEYQQKIAGSIRTSLRRYEQQNRSSSQELFVDVIRSLLVSGGAAKPAPVEIDIFVPDDFDGIGEGSLDQAPGEGLMDALTEAQVSLAEESEARAAAEARIMELEARLDQWSAGGGEEAGTIADDALARELSEARAELEREVSARAEAEARVAGLLARIEAVTAKLSAIENAGGGDIPEQAGLMVSFELTEAQLEQETSDRKKAQKKVEELQVSVDELTTQLESMTAEADAVERDVEDRVAQAWASARADLERESTARAKAEARVEELLAQLDELNVKTTAELTEELNRELEVTRTELSGIQEQYASARAEVASLTAELEQLKNQSITSEKLSVALEDARNRLTAEAEARSEAEQRVTNLERESTARAKAEARVEELLAQLDELNVKAAAELTEELNRELEVTRIELSGIQEQYASARAEVASLTAELEQLKNQSITSEKLSVALEDARNRLTAEAQARSEAEQRVTNLGLEVERLQSSLTGLAAELREATRPSVPALRLDTPRFIKPKD